MGESEPIVADAARPRRGLTAGQWILALVAANLLWRIVRYALGFPIWGDEASVAVTLVTRDFLDLLAPPEHFQIIPLGFLWLEWPVVRLLGESEWALRLVPWLAGLASVPLLARLAWRGLDRLGAVLAVAIFAASYYPVRHAAEVKPYSLDLLAALVLLSIAWPMLRADAPTRRWIVFAIVAAALAWLSYPSVFIAGGVLLVLGIDAARARRGRAVIGAAFAGVLLAASFGAMYALVGAPQAAAATGLVESQTWRFTFPPLDEPGRLPLWFLDVHTGNMLAYPTGGNDGGSAATFVLALLGSVILWRRNRRALLLLLSPLPLMFAAAAMQKYPYGGSARVAQHLVPAVCLLAGTGLAGALHWKVRPVAIPRRVHIACAVLLAFALGGIARDVIKPYKKISDVRHKQVTMDLAAASPPDARWIVFGTYGESPHVPNLLAWGGTAARLRLHVHRYATMPVHWGPSPAQIDALEDGPAWLIVYRDNHFPLPPRQLETYLGVLRARFGAPDREEFLLGEREEAIIVYRFGSTESVSGTVTRR